MSRFEVVNAASAERLKAKFYKVIHFRILLLVRHINAAGVFPSL